MVAVALWVMRRRSRGPLAAFLLFAGTLFPVLGFFNVYPFRFSYVADHFQYLASLGAIAPFAAALSLAARRVAVRLKPDPTLVASALLVAVLGVLTWRQASIYRDAETLYRETIDRNPQAWMAYMNLGTELASNPNRMHEAIAAYEGALRIRPDYAEAQRNLDLARSLSRDEEAAAHLNRGSTYAETPGRLPDAIAAYEAALRIKPDYFRAHYNLGTVLLDVPGREQDAIVHLRRAVEIQPDSVEAHVNLGVALADMPGQKEEAVRHLEFAIARRPDLGHLKELIERLR
jgi:tetratricopeptide (TPR) repeat protein